MFFEMGTDPYLFFWGGGDGAIDVHGAKAGKTQVRTSFFIVTSASVIISLIACAYRSPILKIGSVPKRFTLCPSRGKLLSV